MSYLQGQSRPPARMTAPLQVHVAVASLAWFAGMAVAAHVHGGVATGAASCPSRCVAAGHCCMGNASSCQRPSCQMGCNIASGSASEADCNATCAKEQGCSFDFDGTTYPMCGDCSKRWLDPTTLEPEILPGDHPWWPPGFNLKSCGSCGAVESECMLGCVLHFNPGLAPVPPVPPVPPPTPMPPAPWPNAAAGLNFSAVFSSHMVLQQAPAKAAVYGNVPPSASTSDAVGVAVTVLSSDPSEASYTVQAAVAAGRWKAFLRPTPQTGASYTITAACSAPCTGTSVTLRDVVFGDVWYCAGRECFLQALRC